MSATSTEPARAKVVRRQVASLRSSAAIAPPVELAEMKVQGLLGRYDYALRFPHVTEGSNEPSLVILHGQNGVGKTTILLMLDGLLDLDFDIFRARPFQRCSLKLSTGQELVVQSAGLDQPLSVSFDEHQVKLHPKRKGPADPRDRQAVDLLRAHFYAARRDISFQLITTARVPPRRADHRYPEYYYTTGASPELEESPEARLRTKLDGRPTDREATLGTQVHQFILDAQVNYRQFFRFESDLFGRIIKVTTSKPMPVYDAGQLLETISRIARQDADYTRLGITPDQWDQAQLNQLLEGPLEPTALAVLGAYVEGLDSRAKERAVLADRLLTFESIMREFLFDKAVLIDDRTGLRVEAPDGSRLREDQLSSGEYHLLYLMVTALIARSRGSVIAIDEPEMSMHISWQHRLIRNLLRCASNARPQFILATHSPDVAAEYREFMIRLGPQ